MPAPANVYWSDDIIDATPDRAAEVAVARTPTLSLDQTESRVALVATIYWTAGADCINTQWQWMRGANPDGTYIGDTLQCDTIVNGEAGVITVMASDSVPGSTPFYELILRAQVSATTDAEITGVAVQAFVGD